MKARVRPRTPPEPYQRYRAPLQARWRPLILARDKGQCKACGSKQDPEVAHITDAVAFVRAAGHHRGVTFSYRWDNLVILCGACHKASHMSRFSEVDLPRRLKVEKLQEKLRRLRGWSTPFAVLPPALVPPDLRPRRSFHDTMRVSPLLPFPTFSKYAADGGLVFGDEESKPGQATLARLDAEPIAPSSVKPRRSKAALAAATAPGPDAAAASVPVPAPSSVPASIPVPAPSSVPAPASPTASSKAASVPAAAMSSPAAPKAASAAQAALAQA